MQPVKAAAMCSRYGFQKASPSGPAKGNRAAWATLTAATTIITQILCQLGQHQVSVCFVCMCAFLHFTFRDRTSELTQSPVDLSVGVNQPTARDPLSSVTTTSAGASCVARCIAISDLPRVSFLDLEVKLSNSNGQNAL